METMLEGLVVLGGLTFSLATALLIEELIFGRIFRVVFARRAEEFTTKDTKVHEGNSYHH
jgi:hypothetical protein